MFIRKIASPSPSFWLPRAVSKLSPAPSRHSIGRGTPSRTWAPDGGSSVAAVTAVTATGSSPGPSIWVVGRRRLQDHDHGVTWKPVGRLSDTGPAPSKSRSPNPDIIYAVGTGRATVSEVT